MLPGPRSPRLLFLAPWALSLMLHTALTIVAFFLVWTVAAPTPEAGPETVISFVDPAPVEVSHDEPLMELPDAASEPLPAALPDVPLPTLPSAEAPPPPTQVAPVTRSDLMADQPLIEERRFPDVNFGGLGVSNAQNVVYVVDASGSMVSTLPIVVAELKKSLRNLAPTQQFQVVLFQSTPGERGNPWVAVEHPADVGTGIKKLRYMYASQRNVDWACQWLDGIDARGRSNPIPALEVAVMLRPDAVFLLSNVITGAGAWEQSEGEILARLDALNPVDPRTGRRAIVIKTLQFLEADPTGLLEEIGRLHGGRDGYTFISREDLGL
ncbi:MAG: hypothetical protein KDA21_02215 [Phycisphaerales bacterium]|nr:hypothetical protein [Phycisphaerales bacterium]